MSSLLALAVAISWTLWKGKLLPEKVRITKGVAVLPFENFSPDSGNAYVADGIHEEILARHRGLRGCHEWSAQPILS
jgi:TolB-like protein